VLHRGPGGTTEAGEKWKGPRKCGGNIGGVEKALQEQGKKNVEEEPDLLLRGQKIGGGEKILGRWMFGNGSKRRLTQRNYPGETEEHERD